MSILVIDSAGTRYQAQVIVWAADQVDRARDAGVEIDGIITTGGAALTRWADKEFTKYSSVSDQFTRDQTHHKDAIVTLYVSRDMTGWTREVLVTRHPKSYIGQPVTIWDKVPGWHLTVTDPAAVERPRDKLLWQVTRRKPMFERTDLVTVSEPICVTRDALRTVTVAAGPPGAFCCQNMCTFGITYVAVCGCWGNTAIESGFPLSVDCFYSDDYTSDCDYGSCVFNDYNDGDACIQGETFCGNPGNHAMQYASDNCGSSPP